ncbi:metallophosphoesterase [Flavobacterium ponti]|uniref:Metallophosphoesterase n=1 Tax=Flavobacterium ponti TaxID=665133 RepID=A0ABV9P1U4_9FLAO
MKVTAISDTHGKHKQLKLTGGDLLIHSGDISSFGNKEEISCFLEWFSKQKYIYKIFIAGNHDFSFENQFQNIIIPENVTYLNDSGIEIEGLQIWGSPITPTFCNLAFNRDRGKEIEFHWNKIPANTDILITHGPPYGILDETETHFNTGCKNLLEKICTINLKYHIFGHIHEAFGVTKIKDTIYINAASVNLEYKIRNLPYHDFEINI